MHSAQYGKSSRQKKQAVKNVNPVNLGVATYVVQFGNREGHKSKLAESGSNHGFDNAVVSGSAQNLHASNRQKDHHYAHLSSGHFSEPPLSSNLSSKNKASNPFFTNSYNTSQVLSKPLSPVGAAYEQAMRTNDGTPSKLLKTQVYLPGERVIFAESPSAPGIPIVYRLEEERKSNPDKLNLDRRKLNICPILEGEDNLRLLNFQHNNITKIQHLIMMKKLIFLDFYDNHIDEISGLSTLKSLRVLMLGKNRIRKINNLFELTLLDVLDLHGNKITKIEHVSHLHQLRVLNLAGNELTVVKNLAGLTALSELNLRRNKIHTVLDVDQLPSLQRLFLSFNDIKRFDDILCLSKSSSLMELSLDGNPFCSDSLYKQTILQNIASLRQLDMKRLTEEEKRIAFVMAKKEEEKRKEMERMTSMKERRRLAISNAQKQWDKQFHKGIEANKRDSGDVATFRKSSSSSKLKHESSDYSYCHLAELDGDALNLYGPGSLDAIDKNWGEKTASAVLSITFKFINFCDIVPVFKKLHSRFPSLESIHFELTNISTLNDINAFVSLAKLDNLHISDDGNPVTKLSLWKLYAIYRLVQLNIKTLNGDEITDSDVVYAEKTFGELSHLTTSHLSQWRLFTLFALQKERNYPANTDIKNRDSSVRSPSSESVSKAGLFYRCNRQVDAMEEAERDSFSKNYFREILQDSIMIERKHTYFEKVWPQMLKEMVSKYYTQISDTDSYCKQSLEKIKKSVNVT